MARYGKIDARMWGDAKFLALSAPQPNGQTLWTYLLSGPHRTSIPGLIVAGEAMLAEALGWPLKAFREAFAEVLSKGMAEADTKARVIWIPKAIAYNPPESPNVIRSWRVNWDETPECTLKDKAYQALKAFTEDKGEGFKKAFIEALGEGCRQPSANQEQEPEQEPEPEQEQDTALCSAPSAEAFAEAWNALGKPFPRVLGMGGKRLKAFKARCRDAFWREHWQAALTELPRSKFLRGEGSNGWIANADFFLQPESVQKIVEGKYADNPRRSGVSTLSDQFNRAAEEFDSLMGGDQS